MGRRIPPTLSFIIPVYNAERYLDDCLQSILDQDLEEDEFEVILVNDGSTDDTLSVCRKWLVHTNFILIDQKNQGVGVARNAGLERASGRYVIFIDDDDRLVPHSIRPLFDSVLNQCDLLVASRVSVKDGTLPDLSSVDSDRIVFDGRGLDYMRLHGPLAYCTHCFVRKELLTKNDIRFTSHTIGEDRLFMFKVLSANPRMKEIQRSVYLYMIRKKSVSHDFKDTKRLSTNVRDQIDVFCIIAAAVIKRDAGIRSKLFNSIQENLLVTFRRLMYSDMDTKGFKSFNKKMRSLELLPLKIKGKWPAMINFFSLFPCSFQLCRFFFIKHYKADC